MADFPLWLKILIYLVVGSTAIYTIVGLFYTVRTFG
jgi:hypothetical protein